MLGGKGKNLAEMVSMGLPIPMGFTITTETCDVYYKNNKVYPEEAIEQIEHELKKLEHVTGKKLGDPKDPLLVSVRSGAADSMPGMMDTVLNLGLNDESVQGLIEKTQNPRFVRDSYRRFLQMFGDVVMEVPHHDFEYALQSVKDMKGVKLDTELVVEDLQKVVVLYKEVIKKTTGIDFPTDPRIQLKMSIDAVFNSWNNDRAIVYRKLNDIR